MSLSLILAQTGQARPQGHQDHKGNRTHVFPESHVGLRSPFGQEVKKLCSCLCFWRCSLLQVFLSVSRSLSVSLEMLTIPDLVTFAGSRWTAFGAPQHSHCSAELHLPANVQLTGAGAGGWQGAMTSVSNVACRTEHKVQDVQETCPRERSDFTHGCPALVFQMPVLCSQQQNFQPSRKHFPTEPFPKTTRKCCSEALPGWLL